jgi:transcriptional regulator with XRE-family HTH domain
VGLPTRTRRRVPGLHREEVALLANLSATYYTFLEQGRAIRPSRQVLDALAHALRLSAAERMHLHQLVHGSPGFVSRSVTEFSEVQLRDAERFSVRCVMSSSCSQPSPTKE